MINVLASGACSTEGSLSNADLDQGVGAADLVPEDHGPKPTTDITLGPPVQLSIATFNVRNFFDEADDPQHLDTVDTLDEVAAKVAAIGKGLRRLDADVVALQEVENKQLLERLNQEELQSLNYQYVRLVEGNDVRGIDVALLSRFPVKRLISHAQETFKGVDGDNTKYGFSRDCLEVALEPSQGRELILLINHLRATEWSERSESIARRQAQAQRVREIVDGILKYSPQANLAVIGDLNDTPGSKTLDLIIKGTPALIDPALNVPAAERYTTKYDGKKEQLDHILLAPGLASDLGTGSVTIDHGSEFSATSDHFPVKASFTLE
jgi:endonuclease/exonuclease/phosphatase family metal-dependent hydrolase